MKHAYLIISHNEFEVLERLLEAIDDKRNDIYVHFDKKLRTLPNIHTHFSNLTILRTRIDVRWGNLSQLKAEYALLETAFQCHIQYAYYHIISGTHLPLFSQDYIHNYFDKIWNKDVFQFMETSDGEILLKLRRYNFFTRNFQKRHKVIKDIAQFCWKSGIWIQKKMNMKRQVSKLYVKTSNWCSITYASVEYLLSKKEQILKDYRFTLCADEFFIATELTNSPLKSNIFYCGRLLKCDFGKASNPRIYRTEDYEELINSGCLFARKFSSEDLTVTDKILKHIQSES